MGDGDRKGFGILCVEQLAVVVVQSFEPFLYSLQDEY